MFASDRIRCSAESPGLQSFCTPFTELALRFEWNRSPLARTAGRPDLEANPPALLFVESAWHGNADRWAPAYDPRIRAQQGACMRL
jgi:hypothetical protein